MAKINFITAGFFLTSLIVCNLVDAKQLTRLSNGFECPEPGYFRDLVDCRRFYYCPFESQDSNLKPEEVPILLEIMTKGLECPDGTIFDETIFSCQNIQLVPSVPPECKVPKLHNQSHAQEKSGVIQEISNNH